MEVYLVRHTKPKVEKGTCYGHSDIPVADSFEQEKNKLLKHLPSQADAVYSSPLIRCHRLGEEVKAQGIISVDDRLKEMNFGEWEMKKWDDINQEHLNTWMVDFVNVKVPNGESFKEMKSRIDSFIDELIKQKHKSAVVVTHAGVIRCFVAAALEIPLKNAFKIPVDYASVTKINIGSDNCFSNIEYLNKL